MRKLNDLSQNAQTIRSGEMDNCLFETYKNSVMPHVRYIYATAADIAMAKICTYTPSQHAFPHWNFLLRCCSNCPRIGLPDQESDRHHSNAPPSINFQIYRLIARC